MEKKKKEAIAIFIFGAVILSLVIGLYLNKPEEIETPDTSCDWENDEFRMNYTEEVTNITLIVDYGNGTIETYLDITLSESYTSVFDLLQKETEVDFYCRKFGNRNSFFVTSVNGIKENLSEGKSWQYWINGQYAQVASNVYVLNDNDVVEWKY